MTQPLAQLGGRSAAEFLRDYWQKRPLLIPAALQGFDCPISPEELAGLACEEEVEARLICQPSPDQPDWQIRHGPFQEQDFLTLPASHWTLLVQEINKHVPEFALLQQRFDFIPNWRMDDVMLSYAPDQGGVGPHTDQYDVFLIQAAGKRRWRLSYQDASFEQLIPDLPLKVLANFQHEEEYLLEAGDILYLPPGVVHEGVAIGDCMTISIGFRAPNQVEMLSAYLADCLAQMDGDAFYRDPDLLPQPNPGLISPEALHNIRRMIRSIPLEDQHIDRWFGSFITDVRPGHYLPEPEQPLDLPGFLARLDEAGELWRSEYARFAYVEESPMQTQLYVAGEVYPLDRQQAFFAPLICGQRVFSNSAIRVAMQQPGVAELLLSLYHLGAIYFPE
ncbi:MAG: cupin domain-containing protein [Gammaproteobacteria bacterium]|nr:cupin domain-containing protein [Gammaproteobacteria bacterium]